MSAGEVQSHALSTSDVLIDENCVGSRWETLDIEQLAKLVAIAVMGQALKAAQIIKTPSFYSDPVMLCLRRWGCSEKLGNFNV
jgi:hypothetical protein